MAPKIAAEIASWLSHLGAERRMSPKTVEAYRRDVLQFLAFLAAHLGGTPSLQDLARLAPAEMGREKPEELADIAVIGLDGLRRHAPFGAEMAQPAFDLGGDLRRHEIRQIWRFLSCA